MIKEGWVPPRSPFSLIQEDLWAPTARAEWLILVVCMMLNCTRRKQVEKVLPEFRKRWPDPEGLLRSGTDELINVIRPLGFANRRAQNLQAMSRSFVAGGWTDARELPGVGEYAARAWEIFCRNELGDSPPKDHALAQYWAWRKHHETG